MINHRIDQGVGEIVGSHEPRIPTPFAEPLTDWIAGIVDLAG
jgi:hypothetical protein